MFFDFYNVRILCYVDTMIFIRRWFTLVELIVVITILAILWTIAFVTLQSWTKSSRNSVRISDLNTIGHWLEIFVATHARYPSPTWAVSVTYSGANVWEQGSFGYDSNKWLNSLNTIPVDPLLWTQYAYSVTSIWWEYELWGVLESGTLISGNILYNQAFAEEWFKSTKQWNYNGSVLRTSTGGYDYILGVPTILASDTSDTNILDIIQNKRLVFEWYKIPPAWMWLTQEDFIDFHSSNPNSILIFSWSLQDINTQEKKLLVAEGLKTVYSGTGTRDDSNYQVFNDIDIDTNPAAAMQKAEDVLIGQLRLSSMIERQIYEESGGGLIILPVCDTALTQVEVDELNTVSWNSYTIEDWCTLTTLDMHYDDKWALPQLASIPSGIFKMSSLQELYLYDHAITSIPSTINQLTNLQNLDIAWNQLTSLPIEIGDLNSLVTLRIEANNISSLPSEIWNLVNLQNLMVSSNQISSLPDSIWDLSSLINLQLNENEISSLPSEIWNLTNLTSLTIHSNQLATLPFWFWNLSNLITLDISNNQLSSFPTAITNVTNLQHLLVWMNSFDSLPSDIWNLVNLQLLELNDEGLTSLPPDISSLSWLTYLRLDWNPSLWNLSNVFEANSSSTSQVWVCWPDCYIQVTGNSVTIDIFVGST